MQKERISNTVYELVRAVDANAIKNDIYIDVCKYVVAHGKRDKFSDEDYSGWRFTISFDEYDEVNNCGTIGCYLILSVNYADHGWGDEEEVPNEHEDAVYADFEKFCSRLRDETGIDLPFEEIKSAAPYGLSIDIADKVLAREVYLLKKSMREDKKSGNCSPAVGL